jgi:ABC-type polysaccharide/polyol phosphate export permease
MTQSSAKLGVSDLLQSFQKFGVAAALARDDLVIRFERTILGALWIPISNLVLIGGLTFVFGAIFKIEVAVFVVYLASGLMAWTFISGILVTSPSYFITGQAIMESYSLPWSLQIIRNYLTQVFLLVIHALIWLVIATIFGHEFKLDMLMFIPGIALVLVAGYGASLILATLGARYRDLKFAIESVLTFFFLLTPIFWRAEDLPGDRPSVTLYNPLYHLLSVVRDPLLNKAVDPISWMVAGACAVLLLIIGVIVFVRGRRELLLWM